eukprot:753461-Hanusia_phi.AAC.8
MAAIVSASRRHLHAGFTSPPSMGRGEDMRKPAAVSETSHRVFFAISQPNFRARETTFRSDDPPFLSLTINAGLLWRHNVLLRPGKQGKLGEGLEGLEEGEEEAERAKCGAFG